MNQFLFLKNPSMNTSFCFCLSLIVLLLSGFVVNADNTDDPYFAALPPRLQQAYFEERQQLEILRESFKRKPKISRSEAVDLLAHWHTLWGEYRSLDVFSSDIGVNWQSTK